MTNVVYLAESLGGITLRGDGPREQIVIDGDPGFVDSAGYDFHLTTASPCLNEGLNEDWMIGATDLDGNPRIDRKVGIVDMGCYERLYPGTSVMIQ